MRKPVVEWQGVHKEASGVPTIGPERSGTATCANDQLQNPSDNEHRVLRIL